jgi:leucyl aminopeptidase
MKVSVSAGTLSGTKADIGILPMFEDDYNSTIQSLHDDIPALSLAIDSGDFKAAKRTQTLLYTGIKSMPRVVLIGLGAKKDASTKELRNAAGRALKACAAVKAKKVTFVLPDTSLAISEAAQALAEGTLLSLYKFDKYMSKEANSYKQPEAVTFIHTDKKAVADAKKAIETAEIISEGVTIARDLANAPNNEIYPETLAKKAQELGKAAGVKVTVLNKTKIASLKMGGLLAVNQGSVRPPVFIVMEYNGTKATEKPIVLVGKGVTFDSGGISIKPGAGMSDMRLDMHGSATVIGTIVAAAKLKIKRNIVALVPATENMPDGGAYVPGDVIRLMNGKTVEIDNTDAEGRLILGDALTYADRFKPQAVIDFATLTGACMIALGGVTSGLMGNNDALKARIKAAADTTAEYVCELPLYEEYEEQIKSDYADVKNSGGRPAGAITAGLFLQHFIGDYSWAHIDIAGTGIQAKATDINPKGGPGVGVRMMINMLQNW